jgi:hypothetical protein
VSSCINRRKLVPERVDRGGTLRYAWLRAPPLRHAIKIKPKPQLGCLTQEAPYEGGVISPCLSNIFLHHVLDEWFVNEVKPRLKGNFQQPPNRHPLPAARIVHRHTAVSESLP